MGHYPFWSRIRGQRNNLYAIAVLFFLCAASFMVLKSANPVFTGAIAVENGQNRPLATQPYIIKKSKKGQSQLILSLNYSRGQNATLIIEPQPVDWNPSECVGNIWIEPQKGEELRFINKTPICEEKALDLSPYLHEGSNQLVLEPQTKRPETQLYIAPRLFGSQAFSTLACLVLFSCVAIALFYSARKAGLDHKTSVIAVIGLAYYALWLHFRSDPAGVEDFPGHVEYIRYMTGHWLHYGYNDWEWQHPPLYYILAARVFALFQDPSEISPLMAVRVLATALYMIFCIYGLRTLDIAAERKGIVYYLGVILIVFWPVAVETASNISNDNLTYALWSIIFYYVIRWTQERNLSCLQFALGLIGVMFLVKSTAWLLIAIIGSCMLYALWDGQLRWRQLWQGKTLIAFAVVLLGFAINVSKIAYRHFFQKQHITWDDYVGVRDEHFSFHHFASFDFQYFISHPLGWNHEPDFLNFFLKTMIYHFDGPRLSGLLAHLPPALNVILLVWLMVVIYGVIVCFITEEQCFSNLYPYLVSVAISITAVIAMTIISRCQLSEIFRYVHPMLVPLVILFVRGMEVARLRRISWPLYGLGLATGIALPAGAIAIYLGSVF